MTVKLNRDKLDTNQRRQKAPPASQKSSGDKNKEDGGQSLNVVN